MDSFERLVAGLLEREGYWVRSSYKVMLTKSDKLAIERPTHPRFEIDLVAYKAATNEIRIVECKSYLDSDGVRARAFTAPGDRFAKRFKIFVDAKLRRIVIRRLCRQLEVAGSCRPNPKVELCLVAGRIPSKTERGKLHSFFRRKRWRLLDEDWLCSSLTGVTEDGYTNDLAAVVAKLLLRARTARAPDPGVGMAKPRGATLAKRSST